MDKNLCRCFGAPARRVFPDHLIRGRLHCLDDFEQSNNTAMLVPNTNTRARCTGDDECAPKTRRILLHLRPGELRDVRCNCLPFAIARSDMRVAALRLALLALCAAADGLQAGFTPLHATAASVAARAPVVLARESSPFAKLANVPAPALVASFTGAGLVVVVRGLVEHTACASPLPRSSYSAAGGTGVFNSRPTGRRTLCGRRDRPPKAGPGLAGRGMSLPRALRPELHRAQCAVQYLKNCLIYEPNGLSRKRSGRAPCDRISQILYRIRFLLDTTSRVYDV